MKYELGCDESNVGGDTENTIQKLDFFGDLLYEQTK